MGAAVEIPVVVNIDKAFDEATRRLDAAMQPFKHKLNSEMSGMKLNVSPLKGFDSDMKSLSSILDRVRDKTESVDWAFRNIQMALKNAKDSLNELYTVATKNGGLTDEQVIKADKLKQSILLLETEIDLRTRAGNLASEEARRQIQVTHSIQDGEAAMKMEAKTIAELTTKLSALRERLENLSPTKQKKAFNDTARAIKKTTDQLADYNARFEAFMSKPAPTAAEGSIDHMNAKMKELIAQWNAMSKEQKFDKSGKLKQDAQDIINKFKALSAEVQRYGASLQQAAQKSVPTIEGVTQRLRAQSGVVRMLTSYLSIYTAIFAGIRFLRNIRETTAEFEMQRVALGGIIQDTERANALFKEIKAAAIRSPFQIKDLVTYTKQLSAYRIETDQLFHVTQKLADVSAGLGVDMNRLILAYGQVRAAAVLRGQELRQFTEAGIPLVEELAKKFQQLGREGTTTADVFELISKRAVPFEMIAEIFDDMTERGGVFYKMQEKQAETLKGQWNNLKDALSIMYDEMGNTKMIHGAMTGIISMSKTLFQNWRYVYDAINMATYSFLAFKAVSLFLPNLRRELTMSKKALDMYTKSQQLSTFATETGSKAAAAAALRMKTYSVAMERAAMETNFFKRIWLQTKAMMASMNWVSAVITAITAIGTAIGIAVWQSGKLSRELRKIGVEGQTSINRAVANFKRLADQAVEAADGSKEQADAIDELKRSYGDVIPTQQLEASALRELAGQYDNVTRAIREKISAQVQEQKINTIVEEYTTKISSKQKTVKQLLSSYGFDKDQINAIMNEVQSYIEKGLISAESTAADRRAAFEKIIKDLTGVSVDFGRAFSDLTGKSQNVSHLIEAERALNNLTDSYIKMDKAVRDVENDMSNSIGMYGKFTKMSKDLEKSLSEVYVDPSVFGASSTYANRQEKIRQSIQVYWDYVKKAFDEVNKNRTDKIDITSALLGDGKIDFSVINDAVKEAMAGGQNTKLNTFIQTIQEGYSKLAPSDRIVNLIREKVKQLAEQFKVPMDKAQLYFKDSETEIEDWVKNLQSAEKEYKSLVNQMELNNAEVEAGTKVLREFSDEEVTAAKNVQEFLTALIAFFGEFKKNTGGNRNGYQQDPFINLMNERMKFMQDFKNGYDDLNKYISSSDAMAKVSEKMLSRGLSMGINAADQQRAAKELSEWYEDAMNEAFKQAKKYGASGANYMDFLRQVINDKSNRGKALKDFQKLIQSLFDAKTDIDISNLKREMEDTLKNLKDQIKRSETAQNFMNDIFDLTGNKQLATDLSVSVYGSTGDLEENMKKLLESAFVLDDAKLPADQLVPDLKKAIQDKDVVTLRKYLDYIVDENKSAAEEILSAWEKEEADWLKNLYKTYEKAMTFEERKDLIRDRATATRNRINSDTSLSPEEKTSKLKAVDKQEASDIADVELEALKNTYEWTEAFKDMERVSTETLNELIRLLDEYIQKSGATASPESLKTVTQAREQAQEQVTVRDGYKNAVAGLKRYIEAKKRANKLEKEGKKQTKAYQMAQDDAREALKDTEKAVQAIGDSFNTLSSIVSSVSDVLELDELSDGKAVLEGIASGLSLVGTALVFINAMFTLLETNPVVLAISAIIAGVAALATILSNLSVAKANREIEAQQKLIDELEYSYGQLEKAIAKSFGSDYIYNYTKQLENLTAQAEAYRAQAEAERTKGKKADQDKVKDYLNAARDAEEQIADMRTQLSEFFSGTDLTSAAEDFANAWIEAYKEFGSTTDAMSEKFNEMIESMINRSLAAKIMQEMLGPIFDQIDTLASDGLLSTEEIATIAALAQERIPLINDAMTNLMTSLASAGLDLRTSTAGFHGISKDIAGASEESILGLAAGINTQNFYMSYMPTISENVAQILATMTGGVSPTAPVATTETGEVMPSVQEMIYKNLPDMNTNLSELLRLFRSVVTTKNSRNYVAIQ